MKKLNISFSSEPLVSINLFRAGFLLFLMVLFLIFAMVDKDFCSGAASTSVGKNEAGNCFEYWLNRYQSLLGGILALCGAYLAFYGVRSQIAQTERIAENARDRKKQAAAAVGSFALSQLVDYAWSCMTAIIAACEEVKAHKTHPAFEMPQLPSNTLVAIKDYVEFGDPEHSVLAANLLHSLQIQQSRLKGLHNKIKHGGPGVYGNSDLQQALFDALNIHAQTNVLFHPFRTNYNKRKIDTSSMRNDLRVRGVELDDWPIVKFYIEAYEKSLERQNEV